MTDPGFPRVGANPKGEEHEPIILAIFSEQLHENEESKLDRGGHASIAPLLDPPMLMHHQGNQM